ncbi:tryptophan-rich sensory protein [Kocuria dechangensis]|uniref:Tryptophan-rich sensory protein n=1 Tax=Kocuria dechangensis TaxID=1176249 RepID=A0A917GHR3_9MICC|nr:tryptophan-rich sensory protein [Kocuria dechangensis]GGG46823.1 tryptophan-rich sensory protein [Kocuria dechangensis]
MSTHPAPTRPDAARATPSDRARQVVVTLSEVACVLGTLVGIGIFGTRVEESSGGSLAADATLLAPAGPAFSIWSVIYLGLAAYTVWQWLPSRAADPRARSTGWLAAASMLLNAGWLLVTQQGWIWASVVVIVALVLVLGVLVQRLADLSDRGGPAEWLVVDGTFGLYLGWVSVATAANVAAALVSSGVPQEGRGAEWIGVAVVLVLAAVVAAVQGRVGGRWAVAAAAAWGLSWIAVGRATDEPRSVLLAVAAAAAAVLVVLATAALRRRGRPASAHRR